ncbi:PREDICTED: proline-rich protein 2-like [Capra hircus]|uniref:proline-rich protein 2-like n=1 Tax=Capra hircus TaxID=9925 RepID=UPI0008465FCD|nr:PREDICTED: proline-rich protein 2-like [Capra hircus]
MRPWEDKGSGEMYFRRQPDTRPPGMREGGTAPSQNKPGSPSPNCRPCFGPRPRRGELALGDAEVTRRQREGPPSGCPIALAAPVICIYYANERPPARLPPERPAPPGLSPAPPTGWAKVEIRETGATGPGLCGKGQRRPLAAPLPLSPGPHAAALFRGGPQPRRGQEGHRGGGFHSGFHLIAPGPRTEGAFPSQLGGEKKAEDGPGLRFSALIHPCAPAPTPPTSCAAIGTNFAGITLFLSRLLEVLEGGRRSRDSRPHHNAGEEASRERRGAGAGLRGPEPSGAALRPPRVAVRGPGDPPVGGGRDVLCVPGGENQRPPGEDRCPRVCQRRPFHPCAA